MKRISSLIGDSRRRDWKRLLPTLREKLGFYEEGLALKYLQIHGV
ncbi:MAG: hypothetical protein K0Q73_4867 [Paenibacillus sp.]|jgi:hypothetical protein|nr:hypothetical protein [Paenibacillus sp.]